MYYAVDALDERLARLVDDDEQALFVPREALPDGAAEGDVLECRDGAWELCAEETARRKAYAAALLRQLLES